eukprot:TRINITY_DN6136_c5_g1_i1.p1 TRINITY_DN6136_c5_g1~~TRINITY_DN6136_c5_g1_i1.p1  ORF type:complete len:138 (+),score=29.15 TRINITY_DN6136_c5_g1_i1:97-510(+)
MRSARIEPNVVSYSSIVNAFATVGDAEEAARWLQNTSDARLEPNVVSYTAALRACGNSKPKKVALAERLLVDMLSRGVHPDEFARRIASQTIGADRFHTLCAERSVSVRVDKAMDEERLLRRGHNQRSREQGLHQLS